MSSPLPPSSAAPSPEAAIDRSQLRARIIAVGCLLAVVVATIVALTADTARSGPPPPQITEVRAAERALAEALVARDGAVATGEAIRAARAALEAIDAVALGPLTPDQRRNVTARRGLVQAIGSVLRNPRSPLAAELPQRRRDAEAAAAAAGVPLVDLDWAPRTRD